MRLSVMTLGCPQWDLDTVLTRLPEYGYNAVDFRGLRGTIDLSKLPEFSTDLAATHRKIKDAGLEVSGLSSSISACDPAKQDANVDEAKRYLHIAQALGAKNIRIFGGGPVPEIGRDAAAQVGRETIERILAINGATEVSWNFETHDHWTKTADAKLLLDAIPTPNFRAAWDVGHTSRTEKESPAQTLSLIGSRLGYIHLKDATYDPGHPDARPDGWRWVLPGTGTLPLAAAIAALQSHGYHGWYTFEHEKMWHPTLPDPEVAFPAFIKWIKPLLKS